jgi:hypothetical protein
MLPSQFGPNCAAC